MTIYSLIKAYAYKLTGDIAIVMETENGTEFIYTWIAKDHRSDEDGSFANVLYHIPDDIAKAEVTSFDVIPRHLVHDNEIIITRDTETLYITIPSYGYLYKYITT